MWANRIVLWFYKYLLVITFPSLKNKPTHFLMHFLSLSFSLSQYFSMECDYLELSQFPYEKLYFMLALFNDKTLFVMHFIGDILVFGFSCKLG